MGIAGGLRTRPVVARWFTMLATAALLATGFTLSHAVPASAAGEGTILALINQARAVHNLGPLNLNSSLSSVSAAWANQMATNNKMTHNPRYSSQIPGGWSRAAENVAYGYPSPTAVHDAWMHSRGHRSNILGDFTDIGISFITVGGKTWAVENFAKYGASSPAPKPSRVDRLSGADRYATSIAISTRFDPGVKAVYVATGVNYPDALSAAPAAANQGGPLLLIPPTGLPNNVRAEIQRLHPDLIVVVGGTGAISDEILLELSEIATTRRDGGSDRYETSRIVIERAFSGGATKAFFATGANFPDALSASAAAGLTNSPVFLVNGLDDLIDADTAALIQSLGVHSGVIAGGGGVVSTQMEASLRAQPGMNTVVRYAGTDRYLTSWEINRNSFSVPTRAYFAVGTEFADALAGAALAGSTSTPLYVVPRNCVTEGVVNDLVRFDTTKRVLLGGASVLGNGVAKLTLC